jgi:hypothetical protein
MDNDKKTDYRAAVEKRVKKEATELEAAQKKKSGGVDSRDRDGKITSQFVQECLMANELGDGMLYAAIHKKRRGVGSGRECCPEIFRRITKGG